MLAVPKFLQLFAAGTQTEQKRRFIAGTLAQTSKSPREEEQYPDNRIEGEAESRAKCELNSQTGAWIGQSNPRANPTTDHSGRNRHPTTTKRSKQPMRRNFIEHTACAALQETPLLAPNQIES